MIYGIIILILFILTLCYKYYVMRTVDSTQEYFYNQSHKYISISKITHYIRLSVIMIIDLSIIGYIIYALTTI